MDPSAPGPGTPSSLPSSSPPPSFGTQVRRGLAWQLMGRGGEQGVRLAANLVLARMLAPEEFGLLGMAATGLALADAVAYVGTDQAVMAERRGRRPRFVATAWFVVLVRGVLLSLLLLALAGPAAAWYGEPDAAPLFMLVALQPILAALAHPGAYVALRDLRFGPWTIARLLATVGGMTATVMLALHLRDARALVIGQLATTALTAVAAWCVTPRRVRVAPRPHRRHLARLLRFSAAAAGTPLLIMAIAQVPVVLIGSSLGAATLGVYVMLRRLCETGQQLAVQAAGSVLVPASAQMAGDPARLRATWSRSLRASGIVALGGSGVLAWLGSDVPATILGPAFRGPDGLFAALALAGGLNAVVGITGAFFWGMARPALDRRVQFVRVATLVALALPLLAWLGPTGVALAAAAAAVAALLATVHLMRRQAGLPWSLTARALGPGLALGTAAWVLGSAVDHVLAPALPTRVLIAAAACILVAAPWLGRRAAARPGTPSPLAAPAAPASGLSA